MLSWNHTPGALLVLRIILNFTNTSCTTSTVIKCDGDAPRGRNNAYSLGLFHPVDQTYVGKGLGIYNMARSLTVSAVVARGCTSLHILSLQVPSYKVYRSAGMNSSKR